MREEAGKREGGGKQREKNSTFPSLTCIPDGSVWLWAGDDKPEEIPQAVTAEGCHADVAMEVPCPVPSRWEWWFGEGVTIPGAFSMLTLPVLLLLVQLN